MRMCLCVSACALAALAGSARGQNSKPDDPPPVTPNLPAEYQVWESPAAATIYETGEETKYDICRVWHAACGSKDVLTKDDLAKINAAHDAAMAGADVIAITGDDPGTRAGFHITYMVSNPPAAAIPAIQAVATYLNSKFPDTMNVTVNLSFAPLGGNILGSTTPTFILYVPYSTSRSALIAGRGDDNVMNYLPTPTIPVVYTSGVVTNEDRVIWTTAAYKATVGNINVAADAQMQLSSTFPWDYDPTNGVPANLVSFRDVLIHETGHALGFTSAVDRTTFANDITTMDIFRFRGVDYYPDTYANFTTRARWRVIDSGDPYFKHFPYYGPYQPIPVEDGYPNQASHLRTGWGIMAPSIGPGQTYSPTYFNMQATTVFDYLGYDFSGPWY